MLTTRLLRHLSKRQLFSRSMLLLIALAPMAWGQTVIVGTAYALANQQPLYQEHYSAPDSQQRVQVTYTTPQGEAFAHKTLIYNGLAFQPQLDFVDNRNQTRFQITPAAQGWIQQRTLKGKASSAPIAPSATLVIDAGFNAFIQHHWAALTAGQTLTFDFPLPSRLALVGLSVQRIAPEASPLHTLEHKAPRVYFAIKPTQAVFSLFVDALHLAYDATHQQLLHFHGRSNLTNAQGKAQDVRIDYRYLSPR